MRNNGIFILLISLSISILVISISVAYFLVDNVSEKNVSRVTNEKSIISPSISVVPTQVSNVSSNSNKKPCPIFDKASARNSGYTDAEINEYLSQFNCN